jgi:hypothetical protein
VEALLAGLKVDPDQIRCTSVPGHQTPFGFTIAEELKKDLKTSRAVVTLITSSGLASRWVVFELGASWALGKIIIVVLAPGVTSDRLPGPLGQLPCVSMDSPDAFAQLDGAFRGPAA